jgi:ectoine hydroxylase-related dioxygenase (phytanoyl-CoA dioxygenase family)
MTPLEQLNREGFTILEDVFDQDSIQQMIAAIQTADTDNAAFRKTKDLFAIRQVLKEVPALVPLVFTPEFLNFLQKDHVIVKSIYFDKPGTSNWFVAYHQDLTITVDKKENIPGFGPWTVKQEQFAVQPPVNILENIITIRIHLDDTDENNGALKVIPGSHLKKIYRAETIDWSVEKETICCVPKGGVMMMKPLLLHASGRTVNGQNRRVLHIEFCNMELPAPLTWAERLNYNECVSTISNT